MAPSTGSTWLAPSISATAELPRSPNRPKRTRLGRDEHELALDAPRLRMPRGQQGELVQRQRPPGDGRRHEGDPPSAALLELLEQGMAAALPGPPKVRTSSNAASIRAPGARTSVS